MADKCEKCQTQGLPILPVRYAVVPKDISIKLPDWAGARRVKDVNLGSDYHYALRTLRSGYLYVFYDKNQHGANQWDCYTVTDDGRLVKQPSPAMAQPPTPKVQCADKARHNDTNVQMLVIERSDLCGKAWIAFSEHKWSNDTLSRYQQDASLRDARMQTIKVAALSSTGKHSHGTEATQQAIESVIEYAPGFNTAQLPDATGMITRALSKEDGSYTPADLTKQSTRYPWALRTGEAAKTAGAMKTRAKRADGSHNVPTVLALWDAVGIAHELNGFRNEAAGRIDQYGRERELQISAMNAIDGLSVALAERAGDAQKNFQDDIKQHSSYASQLSDIQQSRANAAKLAEPERSKALQLCEIREDWARRDVPSTLGYGIRLGQANLAPEPRRSQEIAAIQKDVDAFLKRREQNYHQNIAEAKSNAWPKYQEKLGRKGKALDDFKGKWNKFMADADKIIDARTQVLIAWLEAPLFVDTLEDFHTANIVDGILFEDAVSEALFGIGSSQSGQKKIEAWIKEARSSMRNNLLWRVMALNQQVAIADLDAALKTAEEAKDKRQVLSVLAVENVIAKTLKVFADTHKKADGVLAANTTAGSAAGSTVFGAKLKSINTRGIDRFASTTGDFIVRHFKVAGVADFVSEKIIQHMFSVRAMVDVNDSLDLIVTQAANDPAARGQLVQRLRTAQTFLAADTPEIKTAQAENLRAAWSKFKQTHSKAPQAIKDARLAVVVMLIEGLNFQKLLAECALKNDAKSWFGLAASGMTIASGLYDVASVPAKNLFGAESWSYQKIKLFGGLLSAGASLIGAWVDFGASEKEREKGNDLLRKLYLAKTGLGITSALFGVAVTFTYAAPLIGRLTGQAVYAGAARAVGAAAARLVAVRILCMSFGAWITVGSFSIQVLIWIFTDDDLQDWCERCAFGETPDKSWTPKKQFEELQTALKAVGVGP